MQFIREYTGKVDELVKDKIEAQIEVKAKEKEEKDVIAQQVNTSNQSVASIFLQKPPLLHPVYVCVHGCSINVDTYLLLVCSFPKMLSTAAEHVCSVITSCFACATNAGNGWRFCTAASYGRNGDAANATLWHAANG